MKSIIQKDTDKCLLCGMGAGLEKLDKHHVFGGALRSKSEKYGLTVYLHHKKCHIFGDLSVHKNAEIDRAIKKHAQKIAMKKFGWSTDDFIREFYRNYL